MSVEEPTIEPIAPVVATEAPAPVEAPVVAAPVVAEAPKHPHEIPTLLESLKSPGVEAPKAETPAEAPKPGEPEVKPTEAPKPEVKADEPKADEPKAEEAPPAPIEWDSYNFKFADNVKAEPEKIAAFKELAKANALPPEKAQGFVDMFNDAATAFVAEQTAKQNAAWNDTRADWRKGVLASPLIGGAGHLHAMGVVARARDAATEIMSGALPGSPKYEATAQSIEQMLRVTGVGDHPVFLEMLHALGGLGDEPRAPKAVPSPTKTNGVRPSNSLYAPKRQ